MVRARRTTEAPELDEIRIESPEVGDPSALVREADLDGLAFADVDMPSLELDDSTLVCCELHRASAEEANLRGTLIRDTVLTRPVLTVLRAWRGRWHGVRVTGGRVGALEAYDSEWRSVHFVSCKLNYVNLRGADLLDVKFSSCQIDDLDLVEATVRRASFEDTRVSRLSVQSAELRDVDLRGARYEQIQGVASLRGATISGSQLAALAPLLASEVGIVVE
jgi:uncharacterized protein YjbI with pentapeptide repeats